MPKIAYVTEKLSSGPLYIIGKANEIIEAWQAKGYKLTVRQIYYRFIALDWLPPSWIDDAYNLKNRLEPGTKNTLKNYKRLAHLLDVGRMNGLIDWDAIEDHTRRLRGQQHWDSPQAAVDNLVAEYKRDKWKAQKYRVELFVEKDALLSIFSEICTRRDIDINYFSTRGFSSQTALWEAAQRILWYEQERGQKTIILQFSDHDPSGLDMYRDLRTRLRTFGCTSIVVKRMALTIGQVHRFKLPPAPAKQTDVRFAGYSEKFGRYVRINGKRTWVTECWEMDALEPDTLAALVTKAIQRTRNKKAWEAALRAEKRDLAKLRKVRFGRKPKAKKKTKR